MPSVDAITAQRLVEQILKCAEINTKIIAEGCEGYSPTTFLIEISLEEGLSETFVNKTYNKMMRVNWIEPGPNDVSFVLTTTGRMKLKDVSEKITYKLQKKEMRKQK